MNDALEWTAEGAPRSRLYGDIYFSREGGLAESRAVFLEGCGLPEAWTGRAGFVVGELGFGTGLNVLALLQLWAAQRPHGGRLHVMSIEAHPLSPDEAARALGVWPELAALAAPLLQRWPRAPGVTRVDWPEIGATLDVIVGEVGPALAGWDGGADAWFLDGFSPAKNPAMWRNEVLAGVTARSAPGARLATFTVAGAVRRGLVAQGWAVERRPGHGAKRERLEARLSAGAPGATLATGGDLIVVGAGIGGAAVTRALLAEGRRVTVVGGEAHASGNAAGLVSPRLERGDGASARLSAQAFRRAADLYEREAASAVLTRGVRRLSKDAAGLGALARAPGWASGELAIETAAETALALSEGGPASLLMARALVVEPRRVLESWLASAVRIRAEVSRLKRDGDGWRLLDGDGVEVVSGATVVLAAGWQATALWAGLDLRPVRGQVSLAPGLTGPAASWGGYCVGAPEGLLFGATHDRDDTGEDVREADHARNLETLRGMLPRLSAQAEGVALIGRAGIRAATPDHLPLAGPLESGLWVLGGLGGRGFSTAPLLAEHVAAQITGAPSPLPLDLQQAVHPARFAERSQRRGRRSRQGGDALSSTSLVSGAGP
jgi:tRNA 5-methylaminomethyl-2-thiouridine biosynthesis bifunctional protein